MFNPMCSPLCKNSDKYYITVVVKVLKTGMPLVICR